MDHLKYPAILTDAELSMVHSCASDGPTSYRRAIANAAAHRQHEEDMKLLDAIEKRHAAIAEKLIARYDSLQSQYAELLVALEECEKLRTAPTTDSAAQESVCKVDLKDDGVWAHFSCDGKHFSTCLSGIHTARWFVEAFEKKQVKPTPAPEPRTVRASSLTYAEIVECLRVSPYEGEINKAVRVATKAAQAQNALTRKAVIAEIMALPAVTRLSVDDLVEIHSQWAVSKLASVANAAIAHFLASLPELLKEQSK